VWTGDDEIDLTFQVVCGSVVTPILAAARRAMSRRYMASGDDDAITVILDHAGGVASPGAVSRGTVPIVCAFQRASGAQLQSIGQPSNSSRALTVVPS
jgi:hypothetical protein